MRGSIEVIEGEIFVSMQDECGETKISYPNATIENMHDAAKTLANWMGIPYKDHVKECRRIHDRDQTLAWLMDMVSQLSEGD